eukprot:COSAG04_NODE_216_length_19953_cov_85.343558_15_plen_60_part_00
MGHVRPALHYLGVNLPYCEPAQGDWDGDPRTLGLRVARSPCSRSTGPAGLSGPRRGAAA